MADAAGPVGVVYLLRRTPHYHAMTDGERAALDAEVRRLVADVLARGGKRLGRYRVEGEWDFAAAVEFPSMDAFRAVVRRKEEVGYFKAYDATLIVGTPEAGGVETA